MIEKELGEGLVDLAITEVEGRLQVKENLAADGFGEMGWEASTEPPPAGDWLFTRPLRD